RFVLERIAFSEIAIDDRARPGRNQLAVGDRPVRLRDRTVELETRRPAARGVSGRARRDGRVALDQDETHADAEQRYEVKIGMRCQRLADRSLVAVEVLLQALIEEFQAHPGNDRESAIVEAVLRKNGAVPGLSGVEIAERAGSGVGSDAALVAAILLRVIEIQAAREGRLVAEKLVVVAQACLSALRVGFAILDRVRAGCGSTGQRAEATAALALAPAGEISAERL